MAIEPIGTMTAMQIPAATKVQPKAESGAENRDVASAETTTPKLDTTTLSVAKSAETNTQSGDSDKRENTQAENDAIKRVVENINKNMADGEAVFGIHEGTNRVTIKIVDKKTRETIKELPPEKTLDMIARVWEMAGILVDEKR